LSASPSIKISRKVIHPSQILGWIFILLCVVTVLSLLFGRYPVPGLIHIDTLSTDDLAQRLVLNIRMPRILAAVILGMSLGASGCVFQMLFSNPLVEPGFLGVSQGAAFGAAFAIIFLGGAGWLIQGSAVFCGFAGLFLSYILARRVRFGGWLLRLVLAGIAVSALFSSGLGILKYMADPTSQLQEITFWLLGSLASITWPQVLSVIPACLAGLIVIYLMRWRINLLSLSDEAAFSLGAAPGRERALVISAAVVTTATTISISGMVGWVGLIIPHVARRIFGADSRYTLPASMFFGAIFTVLCDDLARTLLAGEIPLGILTSLLGAAFFIGIMMNRNSPVRK
jgi:iron complex transport system permease protein